LPLESVINVAFKEWAIVVDALARGEQIFVLRKGGIHEGRGGFQPEFREFLLFPTLFHQQRDSVIPAAQARYDEIAPGLPPPEILRLEYWAELVEWQRVEDFGALAKLRGQHIWQERVLAERFEWGREQAIYALALRVYRLPMALELPMLVEYGGCKSWIQVARVVPTHESTPVLAAASLDEKLKVFRDSLARAPISEPGAAA
jgi:hypothetical protein